MAKKGKNGKQAGKPPKNLVVSLVITLVLIAVVIYFLESLRQPTPPEMPQATATVPSQSTEKPALQEPSGKREPQKKLPEEPAILLPRQEPVQRVYSAPSVTPVPVKPPAKPRKRSAARSQPCVAVIIDDMGGSVKEAQALLAIHVPLTFSIIPGMAHGKEVADLANTNGYEIMVHMPMEPKDYPRQRLERNGLLLSMTDAEIQRRLAVYLDAVPHAVGANNHMGSRFTEDEGKMRVVLGSLKKRGFYFIDSKTSADSVGERLALQLGLRAAGRQVFLDNVQEKTAIRKQLDELVKIARERGVAIGICHPHPTTIETLAAALPGLKHEGLIFIYASQAVH